MIDNIIHAIAISANPAVINMNADKYNLVGYFRHRSIFSVEVDLQQLFCGQSVNDDGARLGAFAHQSKISPY